MGPKFWSDPCHLLRAQKCLKASFYFQSEELDCSHLRPLLQWLHLYRAVFLKVWSVDSRGPQDSSTHRKLNFLSLAFIDICTDGTKVIVAKTAGSLAHVQDWSENLLVPNLSSSQHVVLHALTVVLVLVFLKPVALKNVLCEAVKTINLIVSWP